MRGLSPRRNLSHYSPDLFADGDPSSVADWRPRHLLPQGEKEENPRQFLHRRRKAHVILPAAGFARGLHLVSPSRKRRAQGRPGARMHPWAFARKDCAKARSHRYRRSHTGLPCAVVYGLYALSRVNLADCHPRQPRRQRRRQLGASLWGARTTRFRSSAASALVSQRLHVHRIPASRAVTIAMRPSCSRRDGGKIFRFTEFAREAARGRLARRAICGWLTCERTEPAISKPQDRCDQSPWCSRSAKSPQA